MTTTGDKILDSALSKVQKNYSLWKILVFFFILLTVVLDKFVSYTTLVTYSCIAFKVWLTMLTIKRFSHKIESKLKLKQSDGPTEMILTKF